MTENPKITPPSGESEPNPEIPTRTPRKSHSNSVLYMVETVISVAVVMATLFTLWNPHGLFLPQSSFLPTPVSVGQNTNGQLVPVQVGLQIGHFKHNEGNACPDGIKEVDVDYVIANKVSLLLAASGISIEVLDEYDIKLINYKADALISIHTGSCTDPSAAVSGFKIGTGANIADPTRTNMLAACLGEQYQQNTDLTFNYFVIPDDFPVSHTFLDVNPQTPIVLIETGSLAVDRNILIDQSDRAANGITAGVLCFLKSEGLINP